MATSPNDRRRHDEGGAALVEFALVLIPLMLLFYGTVMYGLILGLQQSITHTASAAARAAIVTPEQDIPDRVEEVATQQLSWLGSKAVHFDDPAPVVGPCGYSGDSDRRCVTVTIRYPYAEHPIVPTLLGIPVPTALSSTATLELEGDAPGGGDEG